MIDFWALSIEEQVTLDLDDDDLLRAATARSLSARRAEIVADGLAVLDAVATCARQGLVIPEWLETAYRERLRRVTTREVATLDEAFGRPVPKGGHLARLRKERRWGPIVYEHVRRAIAEGRATDEALFELVAERLGSRPGLGRAEIARIYYSARGRLDAVFGTAAKT